MLAPKIELWELLGPYWRLPLRVVWYGELAEVRSGAGSRLTKKQVEACEEKLDGIGNKKGMAHFLTRFQLEKIAEPSRHEDPDDVVEWLPPRAARTIADEPDISDFVRGYCQSTYALTRSPLMADAIWASFCKWMLHWMVNECGEIDLGFAKMFPVPLRKNWASLVARFEHIQGKAGKFDPNMQSMVDRGVADYMIGWSTTGIDPKTRLFTFTLEIITNEKWNRIIELREREKQKRFLARYGYNHVQEQKRALFRILEAYSFFLTEARKTHGIVYFTYAPKLFLSPGPIGQYQGQVKAVVPTESPGTEDFGLLVSPDPVGPKTTLARSDEALREMSDIQSAFENVRDARGKIHGS